MIFYNNSTNIDIDINTQRVKFDGSEYGMLNITVLSEIKGRFNFSNYEVKMYENTLQLRNLYTGIITNMNKKEEFGIKSNAIHLDQYLIKEGQILKVAGDRSYIIVDEIQYNVTSNYKLGSCIVYETDIGSLVLASNTANRNNKWNGIKIEKLSYFGL
jgi:hypothetical protein